MKIFKSIILIVACLALDSYANVNNAMNSFYKNISTTSNDVAFTQTQSANIFSGGGFSTRSGSTTLQPFSFSPPSFNSTCGNINFYSGAFSYLSNSDQLMEFLQNSLIAAAPLIFINALKAISPNLAGSIMSFFDSAQKLLNIASNSCQMGTYLGSMAGTYGGQALSNLTSLSQGDGADALNAMTNNTVTGNIGGETINNKIDHWSSTFNKWANDTNAVLNPQIDPKDKFGMIKQQMANTYGSIIWKGIQSINDVNCTSCNNNRTDVQGLANLIMSLTGDVVIVPQDNTALTVSVKSYAPLMNVENFYESMPRDQIVYECARGLNFNDSNPVECIKFSAALPITKLNGEGFKEKVLTMIRNIQERLVSQKPLSQDDYKLIAMSPMPIFQIAQACADAGLSNQIGTILKDTYGSEIAFMLTQAMVGEALRVAQAAVVTKNVQGNKQAEIAVLQLSKNIEKIQNKLNADSRKYMIHTPVEIMREINFLRSMAQSQYSPILLQKIQFAKSFNNY